MKTQLAWAECHFISYYSSTNFYSFPKFMLCTVLKPNAGTGAPTCKSVIKQLKEKLIFTTEAVANQHLCLLSWVPEREKDSESNRLMLLPAHRNPGLQTHCILHNFNIRQAKIFHSQGPGFMFSHKFSSLSAKLIATLKTGGIRVHSPGSNIAIKTGQSGNNSKYWVLVAF